MVFISVTRLRLHSIWRLPAMAWNIFLIMRQTKKAPGFLAGRVLREAHNTFWTVTMWEGEKAMRAYRGMGPHKQAMPRLAIWCNEASVAHWTQEERTLPDWQEAHRRMQTQGRLSPVKRPSPAHQAKQFATPKITLAGELPIHPKKGVDAPPPVPQN